MNFRLTTARLSRFRNLAIATSSSRPLVRACNASFNSLSPSISPFPIISSSFYPYSTSPSTEKANLTEQASASATPTTKSDWKTASKEQATLLNTFRERLGRSKKQAHWSDYEGLMRFYLKKGPLVEMGFHYKEFLKFYEEFVQFDFGEYQKPKLSIYNVALLNFSKQGDLSQGLRTFKDIKRAGLEPDLNSYLALVRSYYTYRKPHQRVNGALGILKKMKSESQIKPDIRMYNLLIGLCCQENVNNQAIQLFQNLSKENIDPNVVTYNHLIRICRGQKCVEEGLQAYHQMIEGGVAANEETFIQLISMCFSDPKFHQQGWALYEECSQKKKGVLSEEFYKKVISLCMKYDLDASIVTKTCDSRYPMMVPHLYASALRHWVKHGNETLALSYYQKLKAANYHPDDLDSVMINFFCSKEETCKQAVDYWKNESAYATRSYGHTELDTTSASYLIVVLTKMNAEDDIVKLLEELKTKKTFALARSAERMIIEYFEKLGKGDIAQDLLKNIKIF